MANIHYNYETPAEYVYDSDKIEVSGGLASLKEDLTNVYARWHLNEATGATVLDSSGNGRDGTPVSNPISVAGKLNNCLEFDRTNYVEFGNIAGFERTDSFSIECWFKTNVSPTWQMLITKLSSGGQGYHLALWSGRPTVTLYNSSSHYIRKRTNDTFNDNNWHHLIITYDGSSLAAGINIYIDSNLAACTVAADSLGSYSITNSEYLKLAILASGEYAFDGLIDEVVIYDKVLSIDEISFRYNSGTGRENELYFLDKPNIKSIASWEVFGISSWFAFNETLGGGNEGSIGYNLSDDDGVTWYYWNGSAWVSGGDEDHYNSAAVVGANIENFPIINEKILFRAFLISNGLEQCELDNNEIVATVGNPPNVYAGTDKACKDHQTINPFSDAVISDPDGDIENAHAYYDIESSGWIEIPKGGYGTLQDAIRHFEYIFNNIGIINCILRIVDEELIENQDDLNVTISKYTKTVHIQDIVTLEELTNCTFDPGDGTESFICDSPFSYSWEYGHYDITIEKIGYYSRTINVDITNEDDLEIILLRYSLLATCEASIGLISDIDTLSIATWLEINGERMIGSSWCEVTLKDSNGVTKYNPARNYSCTSEGVFLFNKSPSELENEGVYYLESIICYNNNCYVSIIPTNLMLKDLHINIEAIKERTDNLPDDPTSEINATTNKEEIITELEGIEINITNLDTQIKRILGLSMENHRIFDPIYDSNNCLTSATIKIYNNKNDCINNVNPLAIYSMTATFSAEGLCTSYKMVKE